MTTRYLAAEAAVLYALALAWFGWAEPAIVEHLVPAPGSSPAAVSPARSHPAGPHRPCPSPPCPERGARGRDSTNAQEP